MDGGLISFRRRCLRFSAGALQIRPPSYTEIKQQCADMDANITKRVRVTLAIVRVTLATFMGYVLPSIPRWTPKAAI
jgi:hypothetical protein